MLDPGLVQPGRVCICGYHFFIPCMFSLLFVIFRFVTFGCAGSCDLFDVWVGFGCLPVVGLTDRLEDF